MLEVVVYDSAVIAPRVAAEELVAARPRQHDLAEPARELRGVEVGIALPDAGLLEVPDQARHHALHVARLQDHLVMLGAEQVGHALGLRALVEAQLEPGGRVQVEPDGEGLQLGSWREATAVIEPESMPPDR